ncbi:predicted protein [Uncinocarpus reesii 1704]|uniref:Uncharacterized protein n=1 Tax=Uncinocarpus reesii (strain UAMH 1704) TaxID=336963 RepID=C4JM39_UNCRE|nr:uncharacterized protein UREG_03897 [Uncinocarpus reesii 1704]EEP79051.1 predicted protein [Uncinocarpus reesii 1704]
MPTQLKHSIQTDEHPVEAIWNPDKITFEPFDHPVIEGDELQLVPRYLAPSRSCSALISERHQHIHFSTAASWLHWNPETGSFSGIVPFVSDVTERNLHPNADPFEFAEDRGPTCYILHFTVKATLTQCFTAQARFKQTIRVRVAINVSKRAHIMELDNSASSSLNEVPSRGLSDFSDSSEADGEQSTQYGRVPDFPATKPEDGKTSPGNCDGSSTEPSDKMSHVAQSKPALQPARPSEILRPTGDCVCRSPPVVKDSCSLFSGIYCSETNVEGRNETFMSTYEWPSAPLSHSFYTGFPFTEFLPWGIAASGLNSKQNNSSKIDSTFLDKVKQVRNDDHSLPEPVVTEQVQKQLYTPVLFEGGRNRADSGVSFVPDAGWSPYSYVEGDSPLELDSVDGSNSPVYRRKRDELSRAGDYAIISHGLLTPPISEQGIRRKESKEPWEGYPWLIGREERASFVQMLRNKSKQELESFNADDESFFVSCFADSLDSGSIFEDDDDYGSDYTIEEHGHPRPECCHSSA